MRTRNCRFLLFTSAVFFLFGSAVIYAAQAPEKSVVLKTEAGKMAPVTFSHTSHMDKAKAECMTCHHKDPQDPKACKTCHGSEAKGKTLSAKDAFHKRCQTCHKEAMAKGVKAPTKCTECHVK